MTQLSPKLQGLLQSFVDLCGQLVEEAYVVTDGVNIADIVLVEELAHHICKNVIDKNQDPEKAKKEWVVCSIPNAMRYSFQRGYDTAFQNIMKYQQSQKSCEEVSPSGEKLAHEENMELNDEKKENQNPNTSPEEIT